jgi:hypothetical protein
MRQFLAAAMASASLFAFGAAGSARAQYYGPGNQYNQQILSPYLGLTRPGASGGQNWATLVAPQLQTNQNVYQLQQQVALNQQAIQQQPQQFLLLTTGHPTAFLNYRRYFMNSAAVATGTTATGGGTATGRFGTGVGTGGQGLGGAGTGYTAPRSGAGGAGNFAPTGAGRPSLPY